MNAPPQLPPPWYRQGWPWFLIALPASVVVASFITLAIAIDGQDVVVRDDYYKDGLAINRDLEREQIARAHSLGAQLRYHAGSHGIELQLLGDLPAPEQLQLEFLHPTDAARDQKLRLMHSGGGTFFATASAALDGKYHLLLQPLPGQEPAWSLRASIRLEGRTDASAQFGAL